MQLFKLIFNPVFMFVFQFFKKIVYYEISSFPQKEKEETGSSHEVRLSLEIQFLSPFSPTSLSFHTCTVHTFSACISSVQIYCNLLQQLQYNVRSSGSPYLHHGKLLNILNIHVVALCFHLYNQPFILHIEMI